MSEDEDDAMLMATSFKFIKKYTLCIILKCLHAYYRKRRLSEDEDNGQETSISALCFSDLVSGNQMNEALLASDDFWDRMKPSSQDHNEPSNDLESKDQENDMPLYYQYFEPLASHVYSEQGLEVKNILSKLDLSACTINPFISLTIYVDFPSGLDSYDSILITPLLSFVEFHCIDFEFLLFSLIEAVMTTTNAFRLQEITESCCRIIYFSTSASLFDACLEKILLILNRFDFLGNDDTQSDEVGLAFFLQYNALAAITRHSLSSQKVSRHLSVKLIFFLLPLLFEDNFRPVSTVNCELILIAFESVDHSNFLGSFLGKLSENLFQFMSNPVKRICDVIRISCRSVNRNWLCFELIKAFIQEELPIEQCLTDLKYNTTFIETFGLYMETIQNRNDRDLKELRHLTSLAFVWILNIPLYTIATNALVKFQNQLVQLRDSIPSIPDYFNMKILEDIGKMHTFIETYLRVKGVGMRKTIAAK